MEKIQIVTVLLGTLVGGVSGILGRMTSCHEIRLFEHRARRVEIISFSALLGLLASVAFVFFSTPSPRTSGFFLLFLFFALWQSQVDLRSRRLPFWISLAGGGVGVAFAAAVWSPNVLYACFLGGAGGFMILEALYRAAPGKMGGGDPVFASMIGIYTGARGLFLGIMVASVAALVVLVILMLLSDRNLPMEEEAKAPQGSVPFGPFLSLGGIVAMTLTGSFK